MRIGDYLGLDRKKEAELKTVAVFPRAEAVHAPDPPGQLSPFDRAVIERWAAVKKRTPNEDVHYPVSACVCLSYTCAHNCSGCPHGSDRKGGNAFLDAGSFGKLLSCLHSLKVKFVDLRGGGEPTTHPEFHRFAQMCMREGFELSLLTNDTSLDSTTARLLVEGFSFLTINLDADNDEVYNQIHHPPDSGEFQRVLANIERVISEKERRESKLMVGTQIRLCQANVNYMEQMTRLVRDLGIDYVQFRINHWAFDRLLPDQIERVSQFISELKASFDPFPIYGEINSRKLSGGCPASLAHMIIGTAGDVYPCAHFARLPQVTSFGNIFTLPPDELWFGTQHKTVVRRLREYDCPIECCRWRVHSDFLSSSVMESGVILR
ncbi:MAG: radical SAM protein [Candidatus Zixiibacteriota bacterium]